MSALDLPVGPNGAARDINELAQITGWMGQAPSVNSMAFVWHDGDVTNVGIPDGAYTAEGRAINNLGAIAGRARYPSKEPPGFVRRGFYWSDGEFTDLGTLPGDQESLPLDLNDAGIVVGISEEPDTGFIWRNGVMTDLNQLVPAGYVITSARAINNSGVILAHANTADGTRSIILTPKNASPTDLTADCVTDMTDLMVLLDQWGPKPPLGGGDFNADGIVNAADLAELLANWG